jgi:poly(A) polymerase
MPSLVTEDEILTIKSDTSRILNKISRFLTRKDIPSFLVGGFIRDTLVGRDTDDIDIAVDADALEVASQVAAAFNGKSVSLDDINLTGRVILPGEKYQIDFTTLQGNIQDDLARRDFTIDALSIELGEDITTNLETKNLVDPFNGRDDLHRKLIKAVSDAVFQEDAVRLLRAVRLAAELNFSIDDTTEKLISRDSPLITGVAGERIREELLRLLALPGAGQHLIYLDKLGLLTALIPELAPSKGVEQPKEHAWDVFEHSIQTVAALEFLLRESPWEYADEKVLSPVPWSEKLSHHLNREISSGSTAKSMLKLAGLFHDITKPQSKTISEGRMRFLGHPETGAAMASDIMGRLRFSNKEIQLVSLLVRYHLRPTQMSNEGVPTNRAIYRYFRDTGEAGIDLLYLCLADHLAARASGLDMSDWQEHCRITEYVLNKYFEEKTMSTPIKILNGHEIMKIFNLEPGPKVGKLLEEIREAQAAGDISNHEQAVAYAKHLVSKMK